LTAKVPGQEVYSKNEHVFRKPSIDPKYTALKDETHYLYYYKWDTTETTKDAVHTVIEGGSL